MMIDAFDSRKPKNLSNDPRRKNGGMINRVLHRASRGDRELGDVLAGAGVAVALRILGAGCAFLLNIAIGRLLGAEGAGFYYLALSVAAISSVVARLGMNHALLRFVSAEAAQENWHRVAGVFALATGSVAAASLALSLAVMASAPWIAETLFSEPEMSVVLRWIALGICSFALMTLIAEGLKGLRLVRDAMLVSGVIYPVVALLIVWPLARLMGASGAALAYTLATGISALCGLVIWRRAMAPHRAKREFEIATLWSSASKLWVMATVQNALLPWAPLFLLGIWGNAAESGIFGAATRLAMVISMLLVAINSILAPRFSALYAQERLQELERLAQIFTTLVTVATLPLFAVVFLFAEEIMGLFGPQFVRGDTVLLILVGGQSINVVCGSVGYMLTMTGHEREQRNAVLVGLIVMLAIAALVMPSYPLTGAACATAVSTATINLVALVMVYRRLNINMFAFWKLLG